MMKMFCAMRASTIVGLCLVFHGFAEAADIPQSKQLTDAQLDNIAAGIPAGAFASAGGDGSAKGQLSYTETAVTAIARTGGQSGSTAFGQVTAIAISNGPLATASSTLSLSIAVP